MSCSTVGQPARGRGLSHLNFTEGNKGNEKPEVFSRGKPLFSWFPSVQSGGSEINPPPLERKESPSRQLAPYRSIRRNSQTPRPIKIVLGSQSNRSGRYSGCRSSTRTIWVSR